MTTTTPGRPAMAERAVSAPEAAYLLARHEMAGALAHPDPAERDRVAAKYRAATAALGNHWKETAHEAHHPR